MEFKGLDGKVADPVLVTIVSNIIFDVRCAIHQIFVPSQRLSTCGGQKTSVIGRVQQVTCGVSEVEGTSGGWTLVMSAAIEIYESEFELAGRCRRR